MTSMKEQLIEQVADSLEVALTESKFGMIPKLNETWFITSHEEMHVACIPMENGTLKVQLRNEYSEIFEDVTLGDGTSIPAIDLIDAVIVAMLKLAK